MQLDRNSGTEPSPTEISGGLSGIGEIGRLGLLPDLPLGLALDHGGRGLAVPGDADLEDDVVRGRKGFAVDDVQPTGGVGALVVEGGVNVSGLESDDGGGQFQSPAA